VGKEILNKPGILAKVTSTLSKKNINIIGASTGKNSITLFIKKEDAQEAHKLLHDVVVEDENLSSLSLGRDIAMITISSPEFIDTPGIISEITEPLREHNLNIVEISSSQTSVVIFVDWDDGKKVYELVRGVLE